MSESLVTARVEAEKKEAVARILKQMGTTPSGAINQLYDYILKHKALPFGDGGKASYTWEEVQDALAELESLSISRESRFNDMTNEEVKRERAAARGML